MRRLLVVGATLCALTLIIASFYGGRFAERQAKSSSSIYSERSGAVTGGVGKRLLRDESPPSDHILIANVATVSFGELWDVMRAAAPGKRAAWAGEIEQLPPGTRRNAAAKSFFKIWGELDPAAAAHGIETIRDKRLQSLAFYAAADAAADSALPAFAELENRLGYRPSSFNATDVLARWAAADPHALAQFLEAHAHMLGAPFIILAYNWGITDPEKAGEWFASLKLSPLRDPKYPRAEDRRRLEAARGLLEAWLEKDSESATQYALTHANDPDLKAAFGEFAGALFIKSHERAKVFITALPNEDTQRAALVEIMHNLGGLITWREGGDDEEPDEPEIPSEEIPPWLVTLPANLWIDSAGKIFAAWDTTDSTRAGAWLRTLPSDQQTRAITDYCAAASVEQAARVIELSAFIADARGRNKVLQDFVDQLSDDSSETREKIASLPLTKQQKQTLLRRVRDDR